jgi:hypothetical protein
VGRTFTDLYPDLPVHPGPPKPRKRSTLTKSGLDVPDMSKLKAQGQAEVTALMDALSGKRIKGKLEELSGLIAEAEQQYEQAMADRRTYAVELILLWPQHGAWQVYRAGLWQNENRFWAELNPVLGLEAEQYRAMTDDQRKEHASKVRVWYHRDAEALFYDAASRVMVARAKLAKARELRGDLLVKAVKANEDGTLVGVTEAAQLTGLSEAGVGEIVRRRLDPDGWAAARGRAPRAKRASTEDGQAPAQATS